MNTSLKEFCIWIRLFFLMYYSLTRKSNQIIIEHVLRLNNMFVFSLFLNPIYVFSYRVKSKVKWKEKFASRLLKGKCQCSAPLPAVHRHLFNFFSFFKNFFLPSFIRVRFLIYRVIYIYIYMWVYMYMYWRVLCRNHTLSSLTYLGYILHNDGVIPLRMYASKSFEFG